MIVNEKGFIEIEIKELINWKEEEGCIVSDKITKEGYKVGFMYREKPDEGKSDSGWRFFAGNETEEYVNDSRNYHIFALNTISNYDSDIIPYLNSKIGSKYIRINSKEFEVDDGTKRIFIEKQKG